MSTDKLMFAVPSKGRLMEQTTQVLAAHGLTLRKTGNARGYRGAFDELPEVEVAFVSASEIVNPLGCAVVSMLNTLPVGPFAPCGPVAPVSPV